MWFRRINVATQHQPNSVDPNLRPGAKDNISASWLVSDYIGHAKTGRASSEQVNFAVSSRSASQILTTLSAPIEWACSLSLRLLL
jgi:hypothetical protein